MSYFSLNPDCKVQIIFTMSSHIGSIPWPVCIKCPLDLIMISCSSPSDLFRMTRWSCVFFYLLGRLVLRKAVRLRGHSSDTRPPCGTRLKTIHCRKRFNTCPSGTKQSGVLTWCTIDPEVPVRSLEIPAQRFHLSVILLILPRLHGILWCEGTFCTAVWWFFQRNSER